MTDIIRTLTKSNVFGVGDFARCAAIEIRDFERLQQRVARHRHCWRAELNELRESDHGRLAPGQSRPEQN